MPQQAVASVQNKFNKGLVTEYSGLSFPENAATDCDNTEFTLIGNVTRRLGIDMEENGLQSGLSVTGQASSSYVWKNVGGDGNTQLEVVQIGNTLVFYTISAATVTTPLSRQYLASNVLVSNFVAAGGTYDNTKECTYTDGNGYLFVYHPSCDPFYVTYTAGTLTGTVITVQTRDFLGVIDGLPTTTRPSTLSSDHSYNLQNQGWISGNPWYAAGTFQGSNTTPLGGLVGTNMNFTVAAGITGYTLGQQVSFTASVSPFGGQYMATATLTGYTGGTTMKFTITSINPAYTNYPLVFLQPFNIVPISTGYITTWNAGIGNYPSNADVWWYFKNSTGAFAPTTDVTLAQGQAPQGHYILNVFNQDRSAASGIVGLTNITTTVRPRLGTWFQGRVWYTGIDANQAPSGDENSFSWTENIYFSQVVTTPSDFGLCYQVNDPTSETLFDLLPTDGGVISIQGCGSIYKLFSYQNGLLVFTANGIKFITGSQGIGFTANDYTITDISSVHCISGNSFVNVNGLPYFWNEDGIYSVQPSKNGGMAVEPITVTTILQFFNKIPLSSKKYAKGAYHPIDYTIQWIYKDTEATSVADRYKYNKILNYVTYNQAFFPYSVDISNVAINTIDYIAGPGGLNTPEPAFKYFCSNGSVYTFADEHDETYTDWTSFVPLDFRSYFITGYQIRGQAQKVFFPGYVWMFSNSGPEEDTAYVFNSIWDYATSGDTGRWSRELFVQIPPVNYGIYYRRHKLRGHGLALQFKVQSVTGKNFDIVGWTSSDNVNTGI